jgi:tRNA A-37 threonylcarbamoyl transferase component Bud32
MPESPSPSSRGGARLSPHSAADDREQNAPHPEVELPASFGKYFLTEKLATGGMAELYLAKIVGPGGFEKQLVIKQIHPKLSGQRHFVDLFVAEAKTLVTLAHGNIVPVYELGVIDDTYFIAMEYIDGPTLYRLTETLRRKGVAMEPPIAAWITSRILEGLDYAHRKGEGVIHRDLSPRNVMLSRDGEVKLVDFGIAVTLGNTGDDSAGSAPTGSFPYMSPEQVRKQPLTVQTDLFSVGVLFWEMLVGHRLFARSDPDATLSAVIDGDIARPSADRPAVPARLDDVVMRALERELPARWPSAADMLAALQRYLYSLDEPPGPRDLAALVARYCPPETRRLPTHADPLGDAEWAGEASQPRRAATADPDAPRPGPATAVIPRNGAAARGKRPARARTETFATHVALEEILERAIPPSERAGSAAEPITDVRGERADATPRRAPPPGPASPDALLDPDAPIERPNRGPPPGSLLWLGAIGAIGLGAGALFVFYQGRAAVLRPDAGVRLDADLIGQDPALLPDSATAPPDAPTPAAVAPVDAGELTTAPVIAPHDAGARPPRHDARGTVELPRIDAGAPRATGTATLTIGANPWGNVLLDGRRIGRTPIEHLSVPAGRHAIEVIFAGEDPPRTLRYTVDLTDGEAKDIQADFTKP